MQLLSFPASPGPLKRWPPALHSAVLLARPLPALVCLQSRHQYTGGLAVAASKWKCKRQHRAGVAGTVISYADPASLTRLCRV